MKPIVFLLLFVLSLCFSGCEKKCGDDVQLGEELLTENSKTWMVDPDQLVYSNLDGDTLIFSKTESSDNLSEYKEILCSNGSLTTPATSVSTLSISLENMHRVYTIGERKLVITLTVMGHDSGVGPNYDILYDRIFYSLDQLDNPDSELWNYAGLVLTTDDRGSPPCTTYCYPFYNFDEVEINGKIYKDVWYDNPDLPSFYVTKSLGIIAFTDPDGTLWCIVE